MTERKRDREKMKEGTRKREGGGEKQDTKEGSLARVETLGDD